MRWQEKSDDRAGTHPAEAADVAFRLLLGEPAPDDILVPLHLYTADNVGHIDAEAQPPDEAQWFGFDYRTPYFEHWGLTAPAGYLN